MVKIVDHAKTFDKVIEFLNEGYCIYKALNKLNVSRDCFYKHLTANQKQLIKKIKYDQVAYKYDRYHNIRHLNIKDFEL